jgi:3-hydroxyacyl-[acyl-carrier-protein] dehydratase
MDVDELRNQPNSVVMASSQLREILPHGDGFRFVECITALEPGKRVTGQMVDLTDGVHRAIADAHFPGYPVVPGVIIIEALAQVGAVAILTVPGNEGKIVMLAGIRSWRFRRMATPGRPIRLEAELTRIRGRFGTGMLQAFDEESNLLAEGEVSFALADRTAPR